MSLYYFRPVLDEVQLPLLTRFQNLSLEFRPNERISAEVVDTLPSGAAIVRIKGSDIEVRTQIPLQKGMQLELQVLPPKEGQKELQLQIVEIKTRLQQTIEQLLSKNPTSRKLLLLAPLAKDQIKSFLQKESLQEIFSQLRQAIENERGLLHFVRPFANAKSIKAPHFFLDMQQGKIQEQLHQLVAKSGVATKEKLHQILNISERILPKLHKDTQQAQQLLGQYLKEPSKAPKELQESIKELATLVKDVQNELHAKEFAPIYDYTRLMSFLSAGVFVPFFWELGEGGLSIKEVSDRGFLCTIYLELEDVGSVQIDLFMQKSDLLVDIKVQDPTFLEWLQDGAQELRKSLPFKEVFIRFFQKEVSAKEFVTQILQESKVDVKI